MRILIAPQEFKGTLTAAEAAAAIEAGIKRHDATWECQRMPMADGGPGTLDALLAARGGERRETTVLDPLMRPVVGEWAILGQESAAVIECAAASGLWRLHPNERDPRRASSYGTGQLIAAAMAAGCRDLLLGLGGSATNDGGAGMAQALGYRLLDRSGNELGPGGAALKNLERIDCHDVLPGIEETQLRAAIDVTNPLCGTNGASAVYGPQKGADQLAVAELEAALARLADVIERDLGVDVRSLPGGGAAGGLGAGLVAFLGARLEPGGELIAEAARFREHLRDSDVIVTGEGRVDSQTAFGKGPAYLAREARTANRPCICIAGSRGPGADQTATLFSHVEVAAAAQGRLPSREEAMRQLSDAAERAALQIRELVL